MKLNIEHDKLEGRFHVDISGQLCELKYTKLGSDTLELYSTFVPVPLRGQGIAGQLTAFALEYAKSHQYFIVPSCPYIKSYLSKNSQYLSLVKT